MPESIESIQKTSRSPSKYKRLLFPMLRALSILIVLWLLAGCMIQRHMLFPRDLAQQAPRAKDHIKHLVVLTIKTDEGDVEAWLIKGNGATPKSPGPLVFFAHGNAELIDHCPNALKRYQQLGISVLLVEYRGYGRSAGDPSQEAITDDYIAFYDMMIKRADVDTSRIFFHGQSVGGGVVCSLASHRTPKALIVQSTFTSVKDMAAKYFMPAFIVRDPFDNEKLLSQFDRPVLMFHGTEDKVIPYGHSQQLLKVAKHGKLVTYKCGHNNLPPDAGDYWQHIEVFLRDSRIIN
jgi:fermentation-respiration switch protein FrsA (DUF1100 family)